MKKISKILILILILFITTKVEAKTTGKLNLFYEENLYYTMRGTNFYMSYQFPFYTIDNKVAYCIEPGKNITSFDYIGEESFNYSPYNEETNKKLELIGHYGYEYPGHNTINYRTATQVLMWEATTNYIIELWTKQYGYGDIIKVDKEKQEIMNLVNNHYQKPSFDNNSYDVDYNQTLIIEDKNNILSNYLVNDNDGNEVIIENNKITIKPQKLGKSKITLIKKKYDNEVTIVFVGSDNISQKMAKFRASDEITSEININTYGAKLQLQKIDSETKKAIKKSKIKFKIKNNTTNEYICENSTCTFETNEEGIFISNTPLIGNYSIYELEDQKFDNYIWNNKPININIDKNTTLNNDNIYQIEFPNERVKGKIIINKLGEKQNSNYTYTKIPLENVKYGLYANDNIYHNEEIIYKKNELITKVTTDINGQAILENLFLGKYYLKELTSSNDNLIDNTIYEFELKYQDKYTKIITKTFNFENHLPKGKIEFIKVDSKTKEPIKNTLIEIYYNNSLFYQGYTNEQGKIELDNMPLGNYTLTEKESATGYQNNNETIQFTITEDKQKIKLSLNNTMIIQVPNTYLQDYKLIDLLAFTLLIIGIGGIIYAKKHQ